MSWVPRFFLILRSSPHPKLRKLDNTSIRRKLRTYGVKYAYREGEAVEPEEIEPTAAVGA